MRALVTGIGGFAGRHLAAELASHGYEVHGLDVAPPQAPAAGVAATHVADVTDAAAVAAVVAELRPDAIVHLAGAASVGASFDRPRETWHVNLGGTLAVLEAVRTGSPATRTLVVTSGEIFGLVPLAELPVDEHTAFRPHSPYGASKAAADLAACQYRDGYGLDVLRARPFNHLGPGQDTRFVVPAVARQIAAGERDGARVISIRVGNTATRRDFGDVRDVVRAYRLILERGNPDVPYIVGTGRSTAVSELIDGLAVLASAPVEVVADPARRREGEQPDLYGSPQRLTADTGWTPEFTLDTTLRDTLDFWRARVLEEA